MGVRRFAFKGKPVFLDELFNVSADKEQAKHLGVLQVNAGGEFYIAPKPRRRDGKDPYDRDNLDEAKALFSKLATQAAAKKAALSTFASAPTPVVAAVNPVVVQREVVATEGGAVTVKKVPGLRKLQTATQQEEAKERQRLADFARYDAEERAEEQAFYMAEE
jgi:hypothetical protein